MPIVRVVMTLVIGAMGGFLFGMIGSMTYPGIGAILGALFGFALFAIVGCCIVGAWKDCIPDADHIDLTTAVPKNMQAAMFAHGEFTLILTVHEVQNLGASGGIWPFGKPDYYTAVFCGKNPPKSTFTCGNLVWNEQFKINVTAKDRDITIKLLDQDVFKSEELGYVSLHIDQDIIQAGFPQRQEHKIELVGGKAIGRGKKQPQFILSFDYTDDFPRSSIRADVAQQKQQRIEQSQKEWNTQYGSCQKLMDLQFSTNVNATRDQRNQYQDKATEEQEKKEAKARGRHDAGAAPAAQTTTAVPTQDPKGTMQMARAA